MGFKVIEIAARGIGMFGSRIYSQPSQFQTWDDFIDETNGGDGRLEFSTVTGTLLGSIPVGIQNTKFRSLECEVDEFGSKDFRFELNSRPNFPLERFTKVILKIGGVEIFGGFIFDYPTQGSAKKQKLEYKGLGFRERLKKSSIRPTKDKYFYTIESITKDGLNVDIKLNTTLHSAIPVGSVFYVKDALASQNNGKYTVLSKSGDTITALKPDGINQGVAQGSLTILPIQWTEPETLISDLLKHLVTEWVREIKGLSPALSGILPTTTVPLGGMIDMEKMTLDKAYDFIRNMLGGNWDLLVQPDGRTTLSQKSDEIIAKLYSSYDGNNFEFEENLNEIVNIVEVNRKKEKSSDGSIPPMTLGALVIDPTSRDKYGPMEEPIEVPAYFTDEICQSLGEAKVNDRKEPKESGISKKAKWKYWKFGNYSLVSSPDNYKEILNEMDSLEGFTIPEDIEAEISTDIFVTGAGSLKLSFGESADGQSVTYDLNKRVTGLRRIYLYVYGNKVGSYLEFGIGKESFDENVFVIDISQNTNPFLFSIDMTEIALDHLGQFGFRIVNPSDGTEVYIDEVAIESFTALHKTMPLKSVKYKYNPYSRYCELNFGYIKSKQDNWLAALSAKIESQSLAIKE